MSTQCSTYKLPFHNDNANLMQTNISTVALEAAAYQERLDIREARDESLILRVRSGDSEAFYTLVHPYLRAVRSLVRSFIKNSADAEDVVQNAIVCAFSKLHQLRSFRFFRTWLMQIAANEARMMCRRNHVRSRIQSLTEDPDNDNGQATLDLPDWRTIPSVEVENKQTRELLRRALNELPAKYRQVLVLRDVRDFSTEEAARALGLTITLVKTRLRRARLRLRKRLSALRGRDQSKEWMPESPIAAFLPREMPVYGMAVHQRSAHQVRLV
jgi:RNA polymerase sigma-70 factor, ECF subfamily